MVRVALAVAGLVLLGGSAPAQNPPKIFPVDAKRILVRCGLDGDPKGIGEGTVCMTERAQCEAGCTDDFNATAAGCSLLGFTAEAAICHAANATAYGTCLVGCRQY